LIAISPTLFSQGNFSAKASGDWSDATTWNLDSGSDADGVPDADDEVNITNYSINITTTESANNVSVQGTSASSRLFLRPGADLTINGNLTITISSKALTSQITGGSLTIVGDLIYTNPNNKTGGGILIRNDGASAANDKTISVGGDFGAENSNFSLRISGSKIDNPTLVINGGVEQYIAGNYSVNVTYAKINVENGSILKFNSSDQAPYIYDSIHVNNGSILLDSVPLTTIRRFENQITVGANGKITVMDSIPFPDHIFSGTKYVTNMEAGSTSEFIFSSPISRNILTENFNYRNVVFKGDGTKIITNNIDGSGASVNDLTIEDGILIIDSTVTDISGITGDITVKNGATLRIMGNTTLPDGSKFILEAGSTVEYLANSDQPVAAVNNYHHVIFDGSGTKTVSANFGATGDVTINAGILEVGVAAVNISSIAGTLTIKDGATLRIMGNPNMPAVNKFSLEEGSKVEYASNGPQNVLGALDYWHLGFDGTGTKTTSSDFSFQGEMSFSSDVSTLEIDHNITIKSDINNTGFISEVPSGYTFDYGISGRFICERFFISTPRDNNIAAENYRDFSLPLINSQALLSQFEDDNPFPYTYSGGAFTNLVELPIFGVPDAPYSAGSSSNVKGFSSLSGNFGTPDSYNDPIVFTNGSGKITTNAVRFGWGDDNGLTIIAKGEVNMGDIAFNAQKSLFGKDYNLFGNPYPCAIDFEAVVAGNANFNTSGAGIKPTFYVIAPDEFGANNTGFYNAVTNAGTVTSSIPAYQGFFLQVEGASSTNYDFTISEDMKSGEDLTTYKSNISTESPELFSVKAYENNGLKDQIHFYFFEGASQSYDEYFDVKKLEPKTEALTGVIADFYDGKKKMNLLANAIDSDAPMNLQFIINNPSNSNVDLELENLTHLLDVFNCVYVENLRTGETYPVDGNFLSIPMGNVTTETFAIISKNAPELFKISKTDATCFGLEDGLIRVDMSNLPENTPVTVLKNNEVIDAFVSNETSVYKRNVGAGNYEFKLTGVSPSCSYIYRESISQDDEVIADFILSDALVADTNLVFKSTAKNALVNEWFTSLGETYYGDSIVLNYKTAGKHWLKLTAIGNYSHCKDEELKFFSIDSAQTSVGIDEAYSSNIFDGVVISTEPSQLTIAKLPKNTKVELLNNVGQLIQTNDEINGIVIFAPLNDASYIIRLSLDNDVRSYHIGL
jgi:hypothetical protein